MKPKWWPVGANWPEKGDTVSILRGFVFMLLNFQKDTFAEIYDIFNWAPAEAKMTEVDFLIKKGRDFIAREVKSTSMLRPEHFKGLSAIS